MNVDDSKSETSANGFGTIIQILGIIILGFGLLLAVTQTSFISNQAYFGDQSDLFGDLCWIAAGMAIELFGIGLIILGKRK
jgi:uncharacterized Tic20 family protein